MASEAALLSKRCSACETDLLSNAKFCVECGLSTASADGGATHHSSTDAVAAAIGTQQKKTRKKAKLSEGRTSRLYGAAWEESYRYRRLEAYRAEHGNCLVPLSYVTSDGGKLGSWVGTQRQVRKGMGGGLSEERTARLEALGFVWDRDDAAWDESYRYRRLEAYRAEHGDCLVPSSYATPDGDKLGSWVEKQRQSRKGMGRELSEERATRLEALGFVWDRDEAAWDESYRQLEAYRAEHGDCLVPCRYVTPDGGKLGRWVDTQRQARKGMGGELSEERATRLEALGFVWAVRAYLPFSNSLPLEALQPRGGSAVGEAGAVGSLRPEADGLNPHMKHLCVSVGLSVVLSPPARPVAHCSMQALNALASSESLNLGRVVSRCGGFAFRTSSLSSGS